MHSHPLCASSVCELVAIEGYDNDSEHSPWGMARFRWRELFIQAPTTWGYLDTNCWQGIGDDGSWRIRVLKWRLISARTLKICAPQIYIVRWREWDPTLWSIQWAPCGETWKHQNFSSSADHPYCAVVGESLKNCFNAVIVSRSIHYPLSRWE